MLDAQAYFDRVSGHLPGDGDPRQRVGGAEVLRAADPSARGFGTIPILARLLGMVPTTALTRLIFLQPLTR